MYIFTVCLFTNDFKRLYLFVVYFIVMEYHFNMLNIFLTAGAYEIPKSYYVTNWKTAKPKAVAYKGNFEMLEQSV